MKIVHSGTNLLHFLFITIICLVFQNCKKDKYSHIIPDVYVNFSIRLDDPEFSNLNAPGNSVMVTYRHEGEYSAGYDYNGIIVYRVSFEEFYAYDATCPHDFDSISVAVQINGASIATCPVCHSEYNLHNYGYPSSTSRSTSPLKQYKTDFDMDKTVYVFN